MPPSLTHRDRARAAIVRVPKLDFAAVGLLRLVLNEPRDGTIDAELHDDLRCVADGLDAACRGMERIRLRSAQRPA